MAGKAITRDGDKHIGHASPTPNPFHQTAYVPSVEKTYSDGKKIIVLGDSTSCGDPVSGTASKCYAEGSLIHRKGDATGGHGSWVPNASNEGSPKCYAS